MPHGDLPFWHFNIPADQRTDECPEFLLNTSEKDKKSIAIWESDYEYQTWDEVKQIISINRIDLLRRSPIELRKYRQFVHHVNNVYGGLQNFILRTRLRWSNQIAVAAPFQIPSDWKVLYNDWPYGVESGIVHLVVWTKFRLPEHPVTGDVTEESRCLIDQFVKRTFCQVTGEENVIWFRNWKSMKSVETLEHFHVLLNNPDPSFLAKVTGGDKPCCNSVIL